MQIIGVVVPAGRQFITGPIVHCSNGSQSGGFFCVDRAQANNGCINLSSQKSLARCLLYGADWHFTDKGERITLLISEINDSSHAEINFFLAISLRFDPSKSYKTCCSIFVESYMVKF